MGRGCVSCWVLALNAGHSCSCVGRLVLDCLIGGGSLRSRSLLGFACIAG
jgi:hypothetical protein